VIIGKYALESITTGMYVNPFDVLREYIQNATDAIDTAIEAGYITQKEAFINVTIDSLNRRISVSDNGSGISLSKASVILTDIGNSEKHHTQSRGFRGIGRLSGLSYADTLTFRTTALGEVEGTEVVYNAKALRELLSNHDDRSITAEAAVDAICSIKTFITNEHVHFFSVVLDGVNPDSGLLDESKANEYLRQVSPVEFDTPNFSWASVIKQEIPMDTYQTVLQTVSGKQDIRKTYTDSLLINKTTGETDPITDIHFARLMHTDGSILGIVWYSLSNFRGSIADRNTKGLRVRVGNLLVGDSQSLNHIFKDSRFNGWVVGEVHVTSPELILNARRDDFEHNAAYYRLEEQLRIIATDITQRIRSASVARNKALSMALKKVEQVECNVSAELANPVITPATKGKLTLQIANVKKELSNISTKSSDVTLRAEAIEKLDLLTGRIKGATQFKAINLIDGISTTEKNLLARMFRTLVATYPSEEAQHCIDMILSTYSKND